MEDPPNQDSAMETTTLNTLLDDWNRRQPRHQWAKRPDALVCAICGIAMHLKVPATWERKPCFTTHLVRAEPRPEHEPGLADMLEKRRAECGYTMLWQEDRLRHPFEYLIIMDREETVIPRQPVDLLAGKMQVNCPDCLHPGRPESRNRQ